MDNNILLSVEGLKTQFHTDDGTVKAVDGVSFSIKKGETLGLVGESGCGKSVTALSVMRLISQPGRVADGRISFDGVNLLDLPENEMRQVRGNKISMIFQEPMTSLNPVFTVGNQNRSNYTPSEKEQKRGERADNRDAPQGKDSLTRDKGR